MRNNSKFFFLHPYVLSTYKNIRYDMYILCAIKFYLEGVRKLLNFKTNLLKNNVT